MDKYKQSTYYRLQSLAFYLKINKKKFTWSAALMVAVGSQVGRQSDYVYKLFMHVLI
jgi:hypothetical protein